ncbi:MAG: hypothetical protein ACLU1U_04635 [Lachnospiraceae bacterium]
MGCVNGIYHASVAMRAFPAWASVLLQVVMWLALAFLTLYVMTFLSVNSTYKQSVGVNLKSAWHILMRYIVSTIFKFIIALLPVALLLLTFGNVIFSFVIAVFAIFGFFYVIFVWQSHMMIIFSIYNPVEKIKIVKRKTQQPKAQAENKTENQTA